ncbi:P-II family nitrogen regulator [Tepidibacillus infernus]|uniref:Transcriptional regulator n=1 Tax=Tepidibacillus decaturensis TaxID=1413211 RepID=A0A135L2K7_9BACI|nr:MULTISPECIES: P-II family nitrogen regulator [Tepidibacillus]KXG43202.1 transcriptional regulator [Tepidibacillus decaturensis]GBF10937.1 nitrogen regulatory protein P-II 1 [Tepidibacillus sp. HK-1]
MKKIEAIIRPEKLEEMKKSLSLLGVHGMTVTEVKGCGNQPKQSGYYRGQQFTVDLLPKVKIEVVIPDAMEDMVIDEFFKVARTLQVGDGKIFVSTISEVYRIRTGESGENAL